MNIMICLFASLQSSFLAPFIAKDVNLWKLEWDAKLLAIIYGVSWAAHLFEPKIPKHAYGNVNKNVLLD